MANQDTILSMEHITKTFGGVKVLDDVSFVLRKGEVHALIGANGAGKSTLMKILNGIHEQYDGEVLIDNVKVSYQNPVDAQRAGIAMIHQELDLVTNLDVSSNLFLGRELTKNGVLDRKTMKEKSQELLDSLKFDVCAEAYVSDLPPAKQQLVLIARCVMVDARIIVMDEPTSSLSYKETEALFNVIHSLREMGKSIIYISHFLEEIFRVSDRVTVLRDGKNVTTAKTSECTVQKLVEYMVGEKTNFNKKFHRDRCSDEIQMEIRNYSQRNGIVEDVSLCIRKGEVLGIAGVVGSGRSELAKMIFGAEEKKSGVLLLEGKEVDIKSPITAVKQNIALIPEERKKEGLILKGSVFDNISLISYGNYVRRGVIGYQAAHQAVDKMIDFLRIICNTRNHLVSALSGGNQQKVVMGKWLSASPKVLLMDQPTRGVDVGAKSEIYELINRLVLQGTSIVLITDEIEEILNLSDRVLIMRRGKITKEFDNSARDRTKSELLEAMVG